MHPCVLSGLLILYLTTEVTEIDRAATQKHLINSSVYPRVLRGFPIYNHREHRVTQSRNTKIFNTSVFSVVLNPPQLPPNPSELKQANPVLQNQKAKQVLVFYLLRYL